LCTDGKPEFKEGKMTKLHELGTLGQSVWYDNIRRGMLVSGEMQALIDAGVVGVTSNPSIFEKAIAGSSDYDEALQTQFREVEDPVKIFEKLALEDIRRTADLLRPIYTQTDGRDGYVSLEVDPHLAHDTPRTVAAARRLFAALDRPNVMIKVPATAEGMPAIEALIGEAINVNVTLIFSLESYESVAEAYLRGLKNLAASQDDLSKVASVASFFVSRVDTLVDKTLAQRGEARLQGKIAIANAKLAYARFGEIFSGPRWDQLSQRGARVQRPLWASTSTKNPDYPDTLYVDELIGPDTVNTIPPTTLKAFRDHGTVERTLDAELDTARQQLKALAELGVDLDEISAQLLRSGVEAFAQSYDGLLASIAQKRAQLLAVDPQDA
jgi:transaldolase